MATPRDPRFRNHRGVMWGLYLALTAVLAWMVVWSIGRNVIRPGDSAQGRGAPAKATMKACVEELDRLYREQNQKVWVYSGEFGKGDPVMRWKTWSKSWEEALDDVTFRCQLGAEAGEGAPQRLAMAAARDSLLELHRAYTSQVNRFSDEVGSLAQAADASIGYAKRIVEGRP